VFFAIQLEKGIEFIHDEVESFEVGEDKLVRMMLEGRVRATFMGL
jgi:hypothetical protein